MLRFGIGGGSYLHKSKMSGGVFFSRDPLNLTNKHTRKQEGFVNEKVEEALIQSVRQLV